MRQKSDSKGDSREWLPEDFLSNGRRVILNPEDRNYENNIEIIGCDSGYIINHNATESDALIIASRGTQHMPSWNVAVIFDNGKKGTLKMRCLLPVDAPFKTVKRYNIGGVDRINYFEDEEDNENLTGLLIKKGHLLISIEKYDENWFKQLIADAYQRISDEGR